MRISLAFSLALLVGDRADCVVPQGGWSGDQFLLGSYEDWAHANYQRRCGVTAQGFLVLLDGEHLAPLR